MEYKVGTSCLKKQEVFLIIGVRQIYQGTHLASLASKRRNKVKTAKEVWRAEY
jgi:hypothetical protein